MSDAMVTGRMPQGKKEEGNRILASLGVNPSKAINQLYDYVIEHRSLPFDNKQENQLNFSHEEITGAFQWAESISRKNRFSNMTDDEIRAERLAKKGLLNSR